MDIQTIVQQLAGEVAKNPDMLTNLLAHPYSTIGNATGNDNVSKEEASQVVAAMSNLACGSAVDFTNLPALAASMLTQNNGSVHNLANSLLGSGSSQGVNVSNGIPADLVKNVASAVDLSDGLGLDDLLRVAGKLFGGK